MKEQIIIAGFGGQGVMSMGQIIAYSGMTENKKVTWLPSYGPEMRGGTANCQVIVSSEEIASPIISKADVVIVMNLPSLIKFEGFVKEGGMLFINESLTDKKAKRDDIKTYCIKASRIAEELGNVRVAGVVMLGAYLKVNPIVSLDSVVQSFSNVLGNKVHLIPINEKALNKGSTLV